MRPYLFPFGPLEVSTDETTPRSTGYQTTKTIRNEEDFTIHYDNGNCNVLRLRRVGEFEGFEEFPDLYDLGRLPLWNLSDYSKLSLLEIKVCQRNTGT